MARLSSNRMLPLLAIGAAAIVGILVVKGALFGEPTMVVHEPKTELTAQGEEPDADTPTDTIRSLEGRLKDVQGEIEVLMAENKKLTDSNRGLKQQETRIRQDVEQKVKKQIQAAERRGDQRIGGAVSKLQSQLLEMKDLMAAGPVAGNQGLPDLDLPVGFGLDQGTQSGGFIWVEPLGAVPEEERGRGGLGQRGQRRPRTQLASFQPAANQAGNQAAAEEAVSEPIPFFTINNLATLVDGKAFTAMIGRVPIRGQVRDPIPFRVLVGRENLAASGLRVPQEIHAMVFEGTAVGDWTLGCVEGSLTTATFIFQDGTIRTVSTVDNSRAGGEGRQQERLGYISDKLGTPCIAGERITNAPQLLAGQVALAAASAAAEAAAASQTTSIVGAANGTVTNSVTGSTSEFVIGEALSEGSQAIQDYFADRLNTEFEAIYVPAGKQVALLIQKEITIDYDPNGRKLSYDSEAPGLLRQDLD